MSWHVYSGLFIDRQEEITKGRIPLHRGASSEPTMKDWNLWKMTTADWLQKLQMRRCTTIQTSCVIKLRRINTSPNPGMHKLKSKFCQNAWPHSDGMKGFLMGNTPRPLSRWGPSWSDCEQAVRGFSSEFLFRREEITQKMVSVYATWGPVIPLAVTISIAAGVFEALISMMEQAIIEDLRRPQTEVTDMSFAAPGNMNTNFTSIDKEFLNWRDHQDQRRPCFKAARLSNRQHQYQTVVTARLQMDGEPLPGRAGGAKKLVWK